jgi:peroxiredoxin (alkyl hydroperoxide reductase subunit C)
VKEISLTDYKGKYLLLFFYPLNFTYVCPTEIVEFSNRAKDFRSLNCEVVGCSVDSHHSHREYSKTSRADGGLGGVDIDLLSDLTHDISRDYGVLAGGMNQNINYITF